MPGAIDELIHVVNSALGQLSVQAAACCRTLLHPRTVGVYPGAHPGIAVPAVPPGQEAETSALRQRGGLPSASLRKPMPYKISFGCCKAGCLVDRTERAGWGVSWGVPCGPLLVDSAALAQLPLAHPIVRRQGEEKVQLVANRTAYRCMRLISQAVGAAAAHNSSCFLRSLTGCVPVRCPSHGF